MSVRVLICCLTLMMASCTLTHRRPNYTTSFDHYDKYPNHHEGRPEERDGYRVQHRPD